MTTALDTPATVAASHLRNAAALLLEAERGRAVTTVDDNEQEVIRLGLALLPDRTFRAIGAELLKALEAIEGGS